MIYDISALPHCTFNISILQVTANFCVRTFKFHLHPVAATLARPCCPQPWLEWAPVCGEWPEIAPSSYFHLTNTFVHTFVWSQVCGGRPEIAPSSYYQDASTCLLCSFRLTELILIHMHSMNILEGPHPPPKSLCPHICAHILDR